MQEKDEEQARAINRRLKEEKKGEEEREKKEEEEEAKAEQGEIGGGVVGWARVNLLPSCWYSAVFLI